MAVWLDDRLGCALVTFVGFVLFRAMQWSMSEAGRATQKSEQRALNKLRQKEIGGEPLKPKED